MQINSISRLLKTVSLPVQKSTPVAEKTKVVSTPTKVPINKQAAMILRPNRCWISQPIPDKPKSREDKEIDRLNAELKAERNAHAGTRDDLGNTRAEVRRLRRDVFELSHKVQEISALCSEKDSIIKQLEDIKL